MREVELHLLPPAVDYLNFLAEGPCWQIDISKMAALFVFQKRDGGRR